MAMLRATSSVPFAKMFEETELFTDLCKRYGVFNCADYEESRIISFNFPKQLNR